MSRSGRRVSGVPVAAAVVALTGCGTPVAEPVFTVQPSLPSIPEVRPLPLREPPAPIRDELVLRIPPGSVAPDEFDVVNSPGAVAPDEGRPTVVIWTPDALPEGGRQALESALLRRGFAVLDPSGVQRRLRALRDSLGALPLPPGRSPDLSQVLRAVQSGDSPADYLFQVERFVVAPSSDRSIEIGERPATRAHVEKNPGLRVGPGPGRIPGAIPTRWHRGELSARLLDVGTGSIVWLGRHDLESPDAVEGGITIRIATERDVANVERVNGAIMAWNERAATLAAEAAEVEAQLRDVWAAGSTSREFDSEEAALAWQRELLDDAERLERRYRDLVGELSDLLRSPPPEADAEWDVVYEVSDPTIEPDFSSGDAARPERLQAHIDDLVRTLASSLVATILID